LYCWIIYTSTGHSDPIRELNRISRMNPTYVQVWVNGQTHPANFGSFMSNGVSAEARRDDRERSCARKYK